MAQYKYLITSEQDLDLLVNYLEDSNGSVWAYDTETNGKFSRFEIQLVGISFGFDIFSCYIPFAHNTIDSQLDLASTLARLKPIFEDKNQHYAAHNAKFDEMVLGVYGINCQGSGDDTYVMAWLLSEDRGSKGLKSLVQRYLGYSMETYEDIISKAPKKRGVPRDFSFARVSLNDALAYAADDAYFTKQLFDTFSERLRNEKLLPAYERVERPFNRILGAVEAHGVKIDIDYLDFADKELPKIAERVEGEIYEEAGKVFNIGSGKQLGQILYEKLKIGTNIPKTPKGDYATDKKTLSNYAYKHKIVDNVLRRKKIQKTHSTFVEALKVFIERDGKVHPSFNGCGTVTGRLSCREPNLQQIEGDEVEEIKIRNFFIPSEGNVFVVGDYSQVELRVMAHFSKDKQMIGAFASGRDFHEETARGMLGIKGEVSRKQRVVAKTINFGVGYGRGPNSIAEQLGITVGEAQTFIGDYFENFPGLAAYKKYLIKEARQRGYIRTISGRKRRLLPEIKSDDWRIRGGAERQAFNTKIQGSAADIIKVAMISLEPKLKSLNSYIAIQIHDELVVEAPEQLAEDVLVTMKEVMENPLNGKNPLIVPLVTNPQIVNRWGEIEK